MAQAVNRLPLTAEARVRSQASPCKTLVDKVALGKVFLLVLRFSLASIIPQMLHTHFHLHVALTRRA